MLWRKEYRKAGGYLTVEASLMIPLAVFLTGLIFYMTFYLYNRCVASQDAYMLAFRGSTCGYYGSEWSGVYGCDKSPEEIKQLIIGQCNKQFGKKYLGIDTLISTVQTDKRNITVETSGRMNVAFTGQLLPWSRWDFYAKGWAERICPTDCIRKVRLIRKAADKISGHMETE